MRAAVKELIERRYAAVHGAVPASDYPHFCVIGGSVGEDPKAALGFRLASEERLFLEDYLDVPVEVAVSRALDRLVCRSVIVEIGAHASERNRATIDLWAHTARHLHAVADVAVAVLTAPLRSMFARLSIDIVEICDADPALLRCRDQDWGSYYDLDPKVCAGWIAPALPVLDSFGGTISGVCA
jgi:hypothetical protein